MTNKPKLRLPNEHITGDCEKNQRLLADFKKVFDIISQPDLEKRISETKPGFGPVESYFDYHSFNYPGCGAWQRPTQIHYFDNEKYAGTINREIFLISYDSPGKSSETYNVGFHLNEHYLVTWILKSEEKSLTKNATKRHRFLGQNRVINTVEERYYSESDGTGLNNPYIPYTQIEELKELRFEFPTTNQLRLTVGPKNLVEFLVNLNEDLK